MSANTYDVGDLVRVSTIFTDAIAEGAIDPDVVKLSVKTPDGDVVTYTYGVGAEIEKDSVGNYHADLDIDQGGTWVYRWWSTGDGQGAAENYFKVRDAQAIE